MAVEDHPLWPEWKAALEQVLKAKELWNHAIKQFGDGSQWADKCKAEYEAALLSHRQVADKI